MAELFAGAGRASAPGMIMCFLGLFFSRGKGWGTPGSLLICRGVTQVRHDAEREEEQGVGFFVFTE